MSGFFFENGSRGLSYEPDRGGSFGSSTEGIKLLGVISRVRHNSAESGRPIVESEWVKRDDQLTLQILPDPGIQWTTDRAEAQTFPWAVACQLAGQIGGHAITVSRAPVAAPPSRYGQDPLLHKLSGPAAETRVQHYQEILEREHLL